MSFREVLQTTIIPVTDAVNDEFINEVLAIFVHRVPDDVVPSGVAIGVFCDVRSNSDACYFRWPTFIFDAADGSYSGKRFPTGNVFPFHLLTSQIYELPRTTFDVDARAFGGNLVCQRDLSVFSFETPISSDVALGRYTKTGSAQWPPLSGYWAGQNPVDVFMWDPINDIYLQSGGGEQQAQVGAYRASTGAFIGPNTYVAGDVEQLMAMNPPFCMAFSRNNNVTQFNYESGQIMSVGKLPDFDTVRGAGVGERKWCYDRYNHRILFCDLTDLDADGDETAIVRGVSVVPTSFAIMPPYTSKQVQTNRTVDIWTRVIGNAGEPIGATNVNWADQAVGDVAPVDQITDRDGFVIAKYDGLTTGGAETITVTTEQAEGFAASQDQGSGAGNQWVPTIHLDFNNQGVNDDLSAIIPQQLHWDQVGAYGAFGDQVIKRPVKTSSAELRIQSGDDGIAAPAFGGDIIADLSTIESVETGGSLWVGAWVYFPTGFDFSTSTDGLRIFQLRDSFDTFADPDDDIMFELRLKHGGGTTHTGYELMWPNQTVTDTRHDFTAHSSVLFVADTWHWLQYHAKISSTPSSNVQRLWIDDLIVWELVDDAAQYRETGGGGSLVSFTANEAIANSRATFTRADELRVFRDWEGNAPSDQTCYVANVIWTTDRSLALPPDENGNRYISQAFADNF